MSTASLPVNEALKLSPFVRLAAALTLGSRAPAVAEPRVIIALAHDLGMTVIGEGVESRDQYLHLAREGCDEAQGFYFSKPMIASDMTQWLRARSVETLNTYRFQVLVN